MNPEAEGITKTTAYFMYLPVGPTPANRTNATLTLLSTEDTHAPANASASHPPQVAGPQEASACGRRGERRYTFTLCADRMKNLR